MMNGCIMTNRCMGDAMLRRLWARSWRMVPALLIGMLTMGWPIHARSATTQPAERDPEESVSSEEQVAEEEMAELLEQLEALDRAMAEPDPEVREAAKRRVMERMEKLNARDAGRLADLENQVERQDAAPGDTKGPDEAEPDGGRPPIDESGEPLPSDAPSLEEVTDEELEELAREIRQQEEAEPSDAEPEDEPIDEPLEEPVDEPLDEPTGEPVDEPLAEPVDEPSAEPVDAEPAEVERKDAAPARPARATRPAPPAPPARPTRPARSRPADTAPETPEGPPPATRRPTPPTEAPAEGALPRDPKTGEPDLRAEPAWWKLPAEERPYFFSWKNTSFLDACRDLQEMSGLSMLGLSQVDKAQANTPVTFQSAELMNYDEALLMFNRIIEDLDYWVLRRDQYLEIRRCTEWFRQIEPSNIFDTEAAYRQADLPSWELAAVTYTSQEKPAELLQQMVADVVPVNASRVSVIPNTNKLELKSFVYHLDRQLEYLDRIDRRVEGDGRELRVYSLKHASTDDAARLLEAMMPPEAELPIEAGGPQPAQPAPRARTPRPSPHGDSGAGVSVDSVEITEDTRLRRLFVRARPAKHEMIAEYLTKYIDLPYEGGQSELVKLEHAEPSRVVEMILPLLSEQRVIQPPTPRVPQGRPEPPTPAPRVVTVPTGAVLRPIDHLKAVLVKANPDEMAEIKQYIEMLDVPQDEGRHQYVVLEHANPSSVASILNNALGSTSYGRARRPDEMSSMLTPFRAIADYNNDRGLVIVGEAADLEEARTLIAQLDVDPTEGAVEHLLRLTNTLPSTMASILQGRFGGNVAGGGGGYSRYGMRYSMGTETSLPRWIADDGSRTLIVVSSERMWPEIERVVQQIDELSELADTTKVYPLKHASASTLSSILQQSLGSMGGGRYGSPATGPRFQYDPQANVLLVTADERTHERVSALIEQLDRPGPSEDAELRVIELASADADYVADKLGELFGDTRSRSYSPWSMRSQGAPRPSVQIVAEPIGNRILITSSQEDYEKAAELAGQIDSQYAAQDFVRETFTLQHAMASQVRTAVQMMFTSGSGGMSRYNLTGEAGGVRITEVGESLVVSAPREKMEEIRRLIESLDTDPSSKNEIRIYTVEGAGAMGTYEIARNLDQLYGISGRSTRGQANVRFLGTYGSDVLMVSAPTEQMEEIDQTVKELLSKQVKNDLSLVIRHYEIRHARADDVAEMINPILQTKYQEMQSQGGGRYGGYYYGQSGPQVTPYASGRRLMVAAPDSLLSLVETLIGEFDQPASQSTMVIVSLDTAKAEEIAPVVEAQIESGGDGGRSASYRRSRYFSPYGSAGTSASGADTLSVTPVPSSNAIILRGPEPKVAEARELIVRLDGQARPDGPMIKTYDIEHADTYDVVSTIEQILGVGSDMSGTGRRADASGGVIIQTDIYSNRIIVSAPYDKFPLVEQIVELKETMAVQTQEFAGDIGTAGEVLSQSSDGLRKLYRVKGDPETTATYLQRVLDELFGYWEAPIVKSFSLGNQIVVTGQPDKFKQVEEWLRRVEEADVRPQIGWTFKQVRREDTTRIVEMLQHYAPAELRDRINVEAIPRMSGLPDPLAVIDEVRWDEAARSSTTRAAPFVPTRDLAALRSAVANLGWVEAPRLTVATRPAPEEPATAPASRPAEARSEVPKSAAAPASQPAATATDAPGPAAETAATAPSTPTQAELEAELREILARQAEAPATADDAVQAEPLPSKVEDDVSDTDRARRELQEAAMEAFATSQTQIKYDEDSGLIYMVGPAGDVERLQQVMSDIVERFAEIEEETESNIRVFRLRHVDVTVAATILEEMFNERAAAAQRRPQRPQQRSGDRQREQAEDEEQNGPPSERRAREEDEQSRREQEEEQRPAGGQRIRVFPNPRDQTLIVRAAEEDFPIIAELLLKIDRPTDRPPVDIKIFQLERLNAYEVEQAIRTILKIDEAAPALMGRTVPRGASRTSRSTGRTDAMIEQLERQILEMQSSALAGEEGKVTLRPAQDITITSDATTNSIIVSAPADGMALVEKLINELEKQDIPTQIRTIQLQHADAEQVATGLERVFGTTARTRGRRGEEGVTPSQLGNVAISADTRTNSLVVRALETDMKKIEPIINELDVVPSLDQQVQLYPIEHGNAAEMAKTLSRIFVEDPASTGRRAVRIIADEETNTILVWAPETQQEAIGQRITQLEERVGTATTPREIVLQSALPSRVAETLRSMYVTQSGRSRSGDGRIRIEGHDQSMTLFVAAPDEIFSEIERTARMMDQRPAETIEVYELENASATEILGRFKEMMSQVLGQAGGGLGQVFAATADERTNALVVIGGAGTHTAVKRVLEQLDSAPSDATAVSTEMFTLGRGNASSVAATVNSLYGRKNWENGMPAPRAAAEPSANVVYVTGTKAQIEHIRKMVIQPLQGLAGEETPPAPLQDYQIAVKYADVQNLATTLNQLFQQRFAARQRAGIVTAPTESSITIVPEPATQQLLVTCTEKNRELIDTYLATLDVESATDRSQETKVFRLQFADLGSTAQALSAAFRPVGRVSPSEQVTITAEYATQSLIVKAPADDMKRIEALIAEIDTGDATKMTPPETIRLENARASEVATMLNDMIRRTRRRDRTTGTYPITVSAQDDSNTLLVSASSQQDMEEIKGLIKNLDVAPSEDERSVRTYPIQFADLGSVIQAINARFADNARRPIAEQVAITPDHANNALLVTASEDNHERVASIVAGLDKANLARTLVPKTVKLEHARASDVADLMNEMIRRSKRRDRQTGTYPITVSADDASNTLLVTAAEADLQEAMDLIAQLDVPPPVEDQREVKSYPIQFADLRSVIQAIDARFADNARRPIVEQVAITADNANNALLVTASEANHERVASIVAGLDKANLARTLVPKTVKLEHARASDVAKLMNEMIQRSKRRDRLTGTYPITVSADDASNTLLVTAAEADLQEAMELIAQLDVPPPVEDQRTIQSYPVQYATLSSVVTAINARFEDNARRPISEQVAITPDHSNNMLMVTASPANHEKVASLLASVDVPGATRRSNYTIDVVNGDPEEIARTLTTAYRNAVSRGQQPPVFTASAGSNQVVVTCAEEELEEIRAMVAELDRLPAGGDQDMIVVPVQRMTPQEMTQALTEYMRRPGARGRGGSLIDDVKITASQSANAVILSGPKQRLTELQELAARINMAAEQAGGPGHETRVFQLTNGNASTVAGAIARAFTRPGAMAEADRVLATADSTINAVIVTASDEKLDEIAEMVEQLDSASANEPVQKIVRLKHATADAMAQVLTATYRTRRPAPGQSPASITADSDANAVVISATPAEMDGIVELIDQLDQPSDAAGQEMRVIPLSYAEAEEAHEILSEYFRKPGARASRYGATELVGDLRLQASASMNALIVSGSSEQIERVQQLAQAMDREDLAGTAAAPRIIELKNGTASQLATTLTQMFTEPARRSPRARTAPDTIPLILADDATNALIVRARTSDYNQIAETVAKLDTEQAGPSEMELIPLPRGVDAAGLAREIERTINQGELLKSRREPSYRPAQIAVGVDERTPALMVAGSPEMFPTVRQLVSRLQEMRQEGNYTARLIPVRNIPADDMRRVIQDLIDQQQGGSSGARSRRR